MHSPLALVLLHCSDGYTCERCPDQTVPVFRYIMNMKLQDHTGELFVTAFDEVARELLEHTANEVHEVSAHNNDKFRYFEIFLCSWPTTSPN